jgi:hypothetical protein
MKLARINVLYAFPYLTENVVREIARHKEHLCLFIDSGAFSAFHSGHVVTLDAYCNFLTALPFKPEHYFMLDVIADPEATMRNYREMLKRGFNPIPIFTPGAPFEHIDEYLETSEYLGCGGLTEKYGARSFHYLTKVFERAKGAKIHLLGYTQPAYVKHFRPYSCDSTSWVRTQRYGIMDLYVGRGEYISWHRRQARKRPSEKIAQAIRNLGYDPATFQNEAAWRGKENPATAISTRSWLAYMADAEKNIGTKIALACGDVQKLREIMQERNFFKQ